MMFEPNEDEARRAEALSQAIMSTDSTSPMHGTPLYEKMSERIIGRAEEFEKYLKEGASTKNESEGAGQTVTRPQSAFGTYQDRGLDSGSS